MGSVDAEAEGGAVGEQLPLHGAPGQTIQVALQPSTFLSPWLQDWSGRVTSPDPGTATPWPFDAILHLAGFDSHECAGSLFLTQIHKAPPSEEYRDTFSARLVHGEMTRQTVAE